MWLRIAFDADAQRPKDTLDPRIGTEMQTAHIINASLATNSIALQICVATIRQIQIAYVEYPVRGKCRAWRNNPQGRFTTFAA